MLRFCKIAVNSHAQAALDFVGVDRANLDCELLRSRIALGAVSACGPFRSAAIYPSLEPDSKAYVLASRLIASWIAARVTKAARVSARFS